jgi:hypothetical protein
MRDRRGACAADLLACARLAVVVRLVDALVLVQHVLYRHAPAIGVVLVHGAVPTWVSSLSCEILDACRGVDGHHF